MTPINPEVLAAQFQAHMSSCDERAKRDHEDMKSLKQSIDGLGKKVEGGLERVHQRVDDSEKAFGKVKNAALVGVLMLLLSVISYLLINGVPWR